MFFNTALQVHRDTAGQYVDGVWQEGARKQFTLLASVQPTNQNDMAKLEGGREYQQTYTLYSNARLRQANQKDGLNADLIMIDGDEFEVVHTERWQNGLISHHMAIVERTHA